MAVELATAYVNLVPSAKGIEGKVRKELNDEVGPAADAVGRDAGERMSGGFRSSLAGFAKVGAAAFGGLLAAAGGFGLKIAAENQTAQVSFETMLGSADKAQAFLGDLKNFAAKTPFEFPELQTAAGSLISIGVQTNKVIPIMTTLGNVTAGMGTGAEGVKRATVALQQMNAAGKISAEDLNQLRDAGLPVFDLLSAATGKTKEQLAGMAQEGKLGKQELEALMKALETGKGLEKFNGLMDAQSQTLTGMISTIKDTLGQGLATALQPLIPVLTTLLPQVADALGGIIGTVGPVLGSAIAAFLPIVQALLPVLGQIASIAGAFITFALAALLPIIQQLIPPFQLLLTALTPLLGIFLQLAGTVLSALATVLVSVATALAPVIDALIIQMKPVLDQILPLIPQLVAAFLPLIPPLGDVLIALTPLVAMLATLGARVLVKLLPMIIPLIESFSKWAGEMLEKLIPAIEQVVAWIELFLLALSQGDFSKMGEMLSGLWNVISDWFTGTAIPGLQSLAAQLGAAFWGWLQEVVPQIPGKLLEILAAIGSWILTTALPWLGEKLGVLGEAFVGWVSAAIPVLLSKLGEWLSSLGQWIAETAIPWLLQAGVNLTFALLAWIATAIIEAPFKLRDLFLGILNWIVTTAIPWLFEKAGELRDTILSFIVNAAKEAPGKLAEFATAILNFISGLPDRIAAAAKNMWIGITNGFITAINWLIRTWNGFQLKVPEVEFLGQKIGGYTLDTPDLPEIAALQGLATGGDVIKPGLFQVHKDELVNLPGRANVLPANISRMVTAPPAVPAPTRAGFVQNNTIHADVTDEALARADWRAKLAMSSL